MNSSLNFNKIKLNVAKLLPESSVNGPGKRFVIWVQGCSLRCPQCINHEFLSYTPKKLLTVLELFKLVIATPDIEGVTYSGGEPFEQAKGFYYLSLLLRKKGLTIMSYSGYTYDELKSRRNKYISGLLSNLDILIDGRFEVDKSVSLLWRGSRNQKAYFLTQRYKEYEKVVDCEGVNMEFSVIEKDVSFTGNFDGMVLQRITERLKEDYGIILDKF